MSDSAIVAGGAALLPNQFNPIAYLALSPGEPVYMKANGSPAVDSVLAALATTAPASAVVGVTAKGAAALDRVHTQYAGPLTLTTTEWDARVTGQSGGLTTGAQYYVSDAAAGKLVTTAPTGGAGHYVAPLGIALSATTLLIVLARGVVSAG